MQFEEFDKKVQEAASHHHPAYDEKAWGMMEKLLDKHLPQKEKKRRWILFFLLLAAGLGTAGILLLQSRPGDRTVAGTVTAKDRLSPGLTATGQNDPPLVTDSPVSTPTNSSENSVDPKQDIPTITVPNHKPLPGTSNQRERVAMIARKDKEVVRPVPAEIQAKPVAQHENSHKPVVTPETDHETVTGKPEPVVDAAGDQPLPAIQKASEPLMTNPVPVFSDSTKEQEVSQVPQPVTVAPVPQKPQPFRRKNYFFLAFSSGPDISFTAGGKLGTTKFSGGVGIGFTYHDRLTIRTGIYEGRKIYQAGPEAYHAPAIFYVYYPYLENVQANCRIREIPISLTYHFGRKEKNSWLLGAGISSLVMKEQVYDYTYKRTSTGPVLHRRWSVLDQTKHAFSVLTVGAGYQHKLGKRVVLMAEPYVKVPLSGVGYGNVRLYSSGILFSVAVNPFTSRPRKILSAE